MFGSEILEVAIGIIFIFLLTSIICSAIREGIEAWAKSRAAYLERGIRELLHDPDGTGLARMVYQHPLIYSLYVGEYVPATAPRTGLKALLPRRSALPSYIPASSFARALMDIAARGHNPWIASDPDAPVFSLRTMRDNIINIDSEPVQRVMLTAIDAAQGDLNRAQQNIEAWYDSSMDRVSGWYKRLTQRIIFWIALVVAIGMNVNTVTIGDYLYRNDVARAAIVARAEAAARDTTFLQQGFQDAQRELGALDLPLGWNLGWGAPRRAAFLDASDPWNSIFGPMLGWLLTAFAATMGAPFWFDILNKFMVIRSTVKPREKSPEEGSEDRQPKEKQTARGAEAAAVAAGAAAAAPVAAAELAGAPILHEHVLADGCDVPITRVTADEDLPPAEGGVA